MNIWNILIAILLFFLIILLHEAGHFTAAKLCRMKVSEFAIGMGPKLIKKRRGETLYTVKALPIGGSVMLEEDIESDDPRSFRNRPVWMRMIVIAMGPIMNFVLGMIFCIISVCMSSNIATTTIAGFHNGSVSSYALQPGDRILKINGMSVLTTMDISFQLSNSRAHVMGSQYYTYDFEVERNGEVITLNGVKFGSRAYAQLVGELSAYCKNDESISDNISDYFNIEDNSFTSYFTELENGGEHAEFCEWFRKTTDEYKKNYADDSNNMFLDFKVLGVEKDFSTVISQSGATFLSEGRLVYLSLLNLINGSYGLNELSGPVGVVQSVGTVASLGWQSLMTFAALISINVGIVNLLPIPAMDGARLVFLIIEAIRRKPIKAEHEGMVHFVGITILFLLMIVVTVNDIIRIFSGG